MNRRKALAIVLFLTGCSFFSRSKSQFFSLERIKPAAPIATVRGLPIGIDTLELPPGTDRREVVVRQANQKVEVRSNQQWSASFHDAVMHTLAFDLADRLPEGMIVFPGAAKPLAMRSIDVAFEELAAGPEPVVVLDARWVLRTAGQPDFTRHERITVDIPSLNSADIASGMSNALAMLADRIAAALAGSPTR